MDQQESQQRERKKAAAEMLVLALIEARSQGSVVFHVASLYSVLSRLESRDLVTGRRLGRAGQCRRRLHAINDRVRRTLAAQRRQWDELICAVDGIARLGGGAEGRGP